MLQRILQSVQMKRRLYLTMELAELVLPFQKAVLWLYVFGRQHARTLMVNIPKERDHSNENYFTVCEFHSKSLKAS